MPWTWKTSLHHIQVMDWNWMELEYHIITHTHIYTGWLFGTFFIFPSIGNNNPNWLYNILQRGWNHQPEYIYIYTYVNTHVAAQIRMDPPWNTSTRPALARTGDPCAGLVYTLSTCSLVWNVRLVSICYQRHVYVIHMSFFFLSLSLYIYISI